LDITAPVQVGGSDAGSADFAGNTLGELRTWVNKNLSESRAIPDASALSLDPNSLFLSTESEVRVYFVTEGAGYHNTLGFDNAENSTLIFPDASTADLGYEFSVGEDGTIQPSTDAKRSASAPVAPGDFVDLGVLEGGTSLDFFLLANGARGGTTSFSTELEDNPDGIEHVVAYALPGSPFLLIGFEDLWGGGDQDYNDLVFALDIGERNVRALGGAEPGTLAILLGLLAVLRKRTG